MRYKTCFPSYIDKEDAEKMHGGAKANRGHGNNNGLRGAIRGMPMLKCSFCQKTEDQIEKLVAGPDVYICNECVAVAVRLMQDRLGFFRRIRNYFLRFLRPLKLVLKVVCGCILVSALIPDPVSAQWLNYPTSGVPRLPDGSPNLNAPTPRTADGKPDFSGIWEPEKNRACPAGGCADMQVPQEFLNIGWSLKDGPPYQPSAAEVKKKRAEENGKDDPVSRCLPGGVVKLHTTPQLRKIIQIPGLLVTLNEMDATYRQIFTDGRPLPPIEMPSFKGYSSGKWDGDTLVVQTAGFTDGIWLDRNGSPMSEDAKITERFRRANYGTMEIELTIDDAKTYTRPWTIKLVHKIVLDTDLIDYLCVENEKDAGHMVGK